MKDPIKELRLNFYKCLKSYWNGNTVDLNNIREVLETFDPDWDEDHWYKVSERIRVQNFRRTIQRVGVSD